MHAVRRCAPLLAARVPRAAPACLHARRRLLSTSAAAAAAAGDAVAAAARRCAEMGEPWPATAAAQVALDGLHGAGLPWWVAVVALGTSVRLALLPVGIVALRNAAALKRTAPYIRKHAADVAALQPRPPLRGLPELARRSSQSLRYFGGRFWIVPAAPLVTLFGFISAVWANRRHVFCDTEYAAEVVAVASAGDLRLPWFPSLVQPDPLWLLPVACAALTYANLWLSRQTMLATVGTGGRLSRLVLRMTELAMGATLLGIAFTVHLPAGVTLYWAASSALALGQNALFRHPAFLRAVGAPELIRAPADAAATARPLADTAGRPPALDHDPALAAPPPPPPPPPPPDNSSTQQPPRS